MVSRNEPDESHICSLHTKPCETPEVWLEHLFKRYHKAVFRTVYALFIREHLESYVNDVVQEVFLEAFHQYPLLQSHPNIAGWLHITAWNKAKNQIRRRHRENRATAYSIDEADAPELADRRAHHEVTVAAESLPTPENVHQLLEERLSAEQLTLYRHVYLEQRPYEEIARSHNVSSGALRVRIHRLRRTILELFQLILKMSVTFLIF